MTVEHGGFEQPLEGAGGENYRTGYLKLKSVLHDRATGLPAFPVLFDALRSALDQRRQIGVVHVELAELAFVESLYGWQLFDRIVERVATALRAALHETLPPGSLLALNGVAGDRFVAFVLEGDDAREIDAATLGRYATTLRGVVERALEEGATAGLGVQPAVRVGYAFLSLSPFYRFERRVYAVIEEAREGVERRERRRERGWGEELAQIIRDAAVRTYLQPIVRLGTREVVGFEALVRGPSQSMFEAPQAMFALSARLGWAGQLDRVCLDETLRAAAAGDLTGKLFVNVLPEVLADGNGAVAGLRERVARAGFAPADVVIELSERFGDREPDALAAALAAARAGGFAVAVDDVGTGRDSRELVERTRPDFVKLDVSLVRDVHVNLIKQEVLSTLVRIARGVGAEIVAEGVESEAEATALEQAGAGYAQGFLFAVPAPAASVLARSMRGK